MFSHISDLNPKVGKQNNLNIPIFTCFYFLAIFLIFLGGPVFKGKTARIGTPSGFEEVIRLGQLLKYGEMPCVKSLRMILYSVWENIFIDLRGGQSNL